MGRAFRRRGFLFKENDMSRFFVGFITGAGILLLVGCPSPDNHGGPETPGLAASQETADQTWKTVATLRSSDPPFQEMDNILVSDPFTVSGDVRVVMEMPEAGRVDGVVAMLLPADKATDVSTMLKAIPAGVPVTIIGAAPIQVVPDLEGTYVLVNAVPAPREWTLEIQVESN